VQRNLVDLRIHTRTYVLCTGITNLASADTKYTQVVLEHGAVPVLVELLQSTDIYVTEQAVWALANIAGDGPVGRDAVLAAGAMNPMLSLCMKEVKPTITLLRNAVWAGSNFARIQPSTDFQVLLPMVPVLVKLMKLDDDSLLADGAWAFAYLTDSSVEFPDHLAFIVNSGVVPRFVQLLSHPSPLVQLPALRVCGNLATGGDRETQAVISAGAIPALAAMLSHPKLNIRKESAWTLSNIAAGGSAEVDAVLSHPSLLARLLEMLHHEKASVVRKEVMYAISNATDGGTTQQRQQLLEAGSVSALAQMFTCLEADVILAALVGVDNLLAHDDEHWSASKETPGSRAIVQLRDESGQWEKLHQLRYHPNQVVATKVNELINMYTEEEEDEAAVGCAPQPHSVEEESSVDA
jgi:importin subunit alpha-1